MPQTLFYSGTAIAAWPGVEVWQRQKDTWYNITDDWDWPFAAHQHYQVNVLTDGSWWVPASTHPPHQWGGSTTITGTTPAGAQPVNPNKTEARPNKTYIWIPRGSIPGNVTPGQTSNSVICDYPTTDPEGLVDSSSDDISATVKDKVSGYGRRRALVQTRRQTAREGERAMQAHSENITSILAVKDENKDSAFSDSDGLISFVNLSSSFVTKSPQFSTGREVCDKVSNFFATLRPKTFGALQSGKVQPLPGDPLPKTQWDESVTHFMFSLLTSAGGLTNFAITNETYSVTQTIVDFNTDFLKLVFDAAVVPEAIITQVQSFIQSVGKTLRTSWDDKSRNFSTCLLGQCHEAVPVDANGKTTIYFPKVKYYFVSVDSSQQAFTSPCTTVEKVTFNFRYSYYVTGLAVAALDPKSDTYKKFTSYMDKAQGVSYKDAESNLDAVLNNTISQPSGSGRVDEHHLESVNEFGVNLLEYPMVDITPTPQIQAVLNNLGAMARIQR